MSAENEPSLPSEMNDYKNQNEICKILFRRNKIFTHVRLLINSEYVLSVNLYVTSVSFLKSPTSNENIYRCYGHYGFNFNTMYCSNAAISLNNK